MHDKLKVMTVLGTRPEVIRLSEVIRKLDKATNHVLVHTGQNYDYELNEVFFNELGLRKPNHFLSIDTSTLGRAYGTILIESERVLTEERPDALLVLGDTNSAISAIMAKRMHIPIFHMEAGNRSFDENVPEETNRRIVDHISDFNLVYTERSRQHLLSEGLPHRRIYLTGSPLREVLERHRPAIETSGALDQISVQSGQYFLASIHREENVDLPERLGIVVDCLNAVANHWDLPIILSTHPRTRKRLDALPQRKLHPRLIVAKPFGFISYNKLQLSAKCVISDSGSISEESAILGFPAVTLRDSMERPEAMDSGSIMLSSLHPGALIQAVSFAESVVDHSSVPAEYQIKDTSKRTVALVI